MAEAVLHPDPQLFPPGTTVAVYALPVNAPSGYTPTTILSEPTVTVAGVLTVTGLEESPTRYEGRATVGGVIHELTFAVSEQSGGGGGGVESVNTKVGKVTLTASDVGAIGAASPAFTGTPTAPTAAGGTNTTQLATTAYGLAAANTAQAAAEATTTTERGRAEAAEALKAAKAANLSDLANAATARTNLGLNTAATQPSTAFDAAGAATTEETRALAAETLKLAKASNLSDLANAATARANLGLGTAATQASTAFDAAGLAATERTRAEAAETLKAAKASNLSDLASAGTSRLNLRTPVLSSIAVVATTNQAALEGLKTIDEVVLTAGDLVLLTAQAEGQNNGTWEAAAGAWVRPADFATGFELLRGRSAFVLKGTANKLTWWALTTVAPVIIGTTAQTWVKLEGAPKVTEHSFAIMGEVKAEEYPGMFIELLGTEQKKIIGVKVQLLSGTSCKLQIRKNKGGLEGYETLEALSTEAKATANAKSLAAGDVLTLLPSAIVGKPSGLMVTFFVEVIP